jgi:hypothetical protein
MPVVPPTQDDKRLLIVTGVFVALAGLLFAGVLLLATNRSTGEKEPVFLGQRKELIDRIQEGEGSPLYFASPFGDQDGFWLDREGGDLVAYVLETPGPGECAVKWRATRNAYIDCDGNPIDPGELDRYPLAVGSRGGSPRTSVYVDLRRTTPAPGAGGTTG